MTVNWFDRETLDRVIAKHIQKVDVILDIGCGIRPQHFFKPTVHICCEPHAEYIEILQHAFRDREMLILRGLSNDVLPLLPDRSVDSIFMIDLIEHLDKEDGHHLIVECERIARRQIILFTPLGFMPQEYEYGAKDGWGLHGGHWQAHKSGWTPDDFDMGWDIFGSKAYHIVNGKGELFNPSFGAFWAIKNVQDNRATPPVRFAVLSNILNPSPSGQSTMLHRLLSNVHPDHYSVISGADYNLEQVRAQPSQWMPSWLNDIKVGLKAFFRRTRDIINAVRAADSHALIVCSGNILDMPTGYLASIWTRIPFYVHLFDDYIYQWPQRHYQMFARVMARIVMPRAAGVIVPNEFLQLALQRRYGIMPTVVRNPYESQATNVLEAWPSDVSEIKIVYTGTICHEHYDAFRNLITAIRLVENPKITLHLYTDQSAEELRKRGIEGPVKYHAHGDAATAATVQSQADILFFPLAFNSSTPEDIRTSAPGKMGEYLANGRPIIAHAPANSFVSEYCKTHEVALVVDRPDPADLAKAIQRIIEDQELRVKMTAKARERAQIDHSVQALFDLMRTTALKHSSNRGASNL